MNDSQQRSEWTDTAFARALVWSGIGLVVSLITQGFMMASSMDEL